MVRRDVVARKVARAAERLDQAERILSRPLDEFLGGGESRDLACFYLMLAIQECIDLAAHWLADSGWVTPDDSASTFDTLAGNGVIAEELATRMRGAVGLRNLIAHGYADVDFARLHRESGEGIESARRYLDALASRAGL